MGFPSGTCGGHAQHTSQQAQRTAPAGRGQRRLPSPPLPSSPLPFPAHLIPAAPVGGDAVLDVVAVQAADGQEDQVLLGVVAAGAQEGHQLALNVVKPLLGPGSAGKEGVSNGCMTRCRRGLGRCAGLHQHTLARRPPRVSAAERHCRRRPPPARSSHHSPLGVAMEESSILLTTTTSLVTPSVLASCACSRVCPPRSYPVSNSPCQGGRGPSRRECQRVLSLWLAADGAGE